MSSAINLYDNYILPLKRKIRKRETQERERERKREREREREREAEGQRFLYLVEKLLLSNLLKIIQNYYSNFS